MSGDVQPRKRKDKKRRKDETVEQSSPAPPQINPQPKDNSDDVNIHVYKERGTGGNICSKIIFILLSSALIVLIGLIITEYRGLTDLDTTIDTESKYAQIFEGWVDNSVDDHGEHDDIEDLIDSHEEEEVEENEASEEADENHDEDDEETQEDDDDVEQEEDDEDNQTQEDDDSELQEDDDNETQEDDNETQEDDNETQEDDNETQEDDEIQEDDNQTQEDDDDDDEPLQDDEDAVSEEKPDDDDDDNSQPIDSQEDDKTDQIDDEDDNTLDQDNESEEQEKSKEVSEEEQKDVSEEEDAVEKKQASEETEDPKPEEDTVSSSTSNMLVKVGVGLAILVVAHTVFIRKWKSAPGDVPRDDDFKETTPDLSRRNTIVPPPSLQEIEQDIENDEEEYSDEEGEYSEEEAPIERQSAKEKYQDLRSTYSRSMTPESDPDREEEVEEEEEEDDEVEEEWEGESEGEDYNEEEDEELLKRLEAKYGKIDSKGKVQDDDFASWERVNPNDEEKQSDDEAYEHKDITSEDDWEIKDRIDEAQKTIDNNAAYAIKRFDAILDQFPNSPRSLYGKAAALDKLADQKRSNEILQKALALYIEVLNNKKTPDGLFELVANQCIGRLRFLGQYKKAISVHNALIERFPDNCKYSNQLAVTYLTINRISEARDLLQKIISKFPNDGFALVHYGFVLKTSDNNLEEAVKYMRKGINTGDEGVIDGRFFFHLGDALTRLGRNDEALKLYEDGVNYGLFLSKYQRSLYNVKRLSAKPWWIHEDLPSYKILKDLEDNWKNIRKEGLSILSQKGYFQDESENLRDKGDWKQFELFARGQKNLNNCKKCPITCQIIERNPEARFCKRGQTKFSVIHPGTHVWPHCGPTNCRLRAHLGLKVPQGTYIRVADDTRSWKEGQILIFDDSFEHEVWHNGTDFRLVLIVDIWHPELTEAEKKSLSPI